MPPVRSLVFKHRTYIVAVILLLSKIMPIYSHYTKKKLICVIIIALFGCQPSSYSKCTKANTCSLYDVRLVSINKYIFGFFYDAYHLSQL